jgi:mannose-6-phosphate isomerase-like protein (cupin superfamily)
LWETSKPGEGPVVTAPDGSTVHPRARLDGLASFAEFVLEPGQVSAAVEHVTVQEIWYVTAGSGELWRRGFGHSEVVALVPGVCATIPLGTAFQFRADSAGLHVVAATVPSWPDGSDEARATTGHW